MNEANQELTRLRKYFAIEPDQLVVDYMIDYIKKLQRVDGEAHPWYGPCDGMGENNGCSECQRVAKLVIEQDEILGKIYEVLKIK